LDYFDIGANASRGDARFHSQFSTLLVALTRLVDDKDNHHGGHPRHLHREAGEKIITSPATNPTMIVQPMCQNGLPTTISRLYTRKSGIR
jgi:hypothetical protein